MRNGGPGCIAAQSQDSMSWVCYGQAAASAPAAKLRPRGSTKHRQLPACTSRPRTAARTHRAGIINTAGMNRRVPSDPIPTYRTCNVSVAELSRLGTAYERRPAIGPARRASRHRPLTPRHKDARGNLLPRTQPCQSSPATTRSAHARAPSAPISGSNYVIEPFLLFILQNLHIVTVETALFRHHIPRHLRLTSHALFYLKERCSGMKSP